nr:MAG TPA: hypothetical protein [Caudoviricetes sp.]
MGGSSLKWKLPCKKNLYEDYFLVTATSARTIQA